MLLVDSLIPIILILFIHIYRFGEPMRAIRLLLPLFITFSIYASDASLEVSGVFVNDEGCRADIVMCYHWLDEDNYLHKSCRMTVSVDGQRVARLGKGGKITDASLDKVVAKDQGLRSTIGPIPSYVNIKAEIYPAYTYKDPNLFPEYSIGAFDLIVKKGTFGRVVAECNNMVRE